MIEDKTSKNESIVNVDEQSPKRKRKATREKSHFCQECRWYDKGSEREFHRRVGKKDEAGNRGEIVELRAICRNFNASSFKHLVMARYSKRQCEVWEKGTYTR